MQVLLILPEVILFFPGETGILLKIHLLLNIILINGMDYIQGKTLLEQGKNKRVLYFTNKRLPGEKYCL